MRSEEKIKSPLRTPHSAIGTSLAQGIRGGLSYRTWFGFVVSFLGIVALSIFLFRGSLALLAGYLGYMSLACTFLPLPTAPAILWLSRPDIVNASPFYIALLGTVGTTIANLNDYYLLSFFLRYRHLKRIQETSFHRRAIRWFEKAPFLTLAASSFLPVPLDVVRLLAISGRYGRVKFATASFLGRLPRYLILAYLGYELKLSNALILAILAVTAGVGLTGSVRRLFRRSKEGKNLGLKNAKISLILMAMFIWVTNAFSSEVSEEALERILKKMEERADRTESVTAKFKLSRFSHTFEETSEKEGAIYYAKSKTSGKREFRMDILKPSVKQYYANDERAIEYEPEAKVVHWYDLTQKERPLTEERGRPAISIGLVDSPEELKKHFTITLDRWEEVAGKKCALLQLVPKDESVETDYQKLLLWVEEEEALPIKVWGLRGDEEDTYEFGDIKINPKLAQGTFDFKIPEGVAVDRHE